MNHDIGPVSAELAEDIVFESELIPSYGDMEMMLTQEGVNLNRHAKNFLSEIASLPALDADGAAHLASRLDSDPAAKADLIEGLMRIVVCAAKRYIGRGVTFLDLLQEGSLGLVGAAETLRMTGLRLGAAWVSAENFLFISRASLFKSFSLSIKYSPFLSPEKNYFQKKQNSASKEALERL